MKLKALIRRAGTDEIIAAAQREHDGRVILGARNRFFDDLMAFVKVTPWGAGGVEGPWAYRSFRRLCLTRCTQEDFAREFYVPQEWHNVAGVEIDYATVVKGWM